MIGSTDVRFGSTSPRIAPLVAVAQEVMLPTLLVVRFNMRLLQQQALLIVLGGYGQGGYGRGGYGQGGYGGGGNYQQGNAYGQGKSRDCQGDHILE